MRSKDPRQSPKPIHVTGATLRLLSAFVNVNQGELIGRVANALEARQVVYANARHRAAAVPELRATAMGSVTTAIADVLAYTQEAVGRHGGGDR